MAKAPEKNAKTQRERFIEAARDVGAVEDEKEFERQLKAVAGGNSSTAQVSDKAGKKKPEKARK